MSSWPIFHLYLFPFVAFTATTQCSEITCDSKITSNWNTITQEIKALRSCQRLFLTFEISGIPLKFKSRVYFVSLVFSMIFSYIFFRRREIWGRDSQRPGKARTCLQNSRPQRSKNFCAEAKFKIYMLQEKLTWVCQYIFFFFPSGSRRCVKLLE